MQLRQTICKIWPESERRISIPPLQVRRALSGGEVDAYARGTKEE